MIVYYSVLQYAIAGQTRSRTIILVSTGALACRIRPFALAKKQKLSQVKHTFIDVDTDETPPAGVRRRRSAQPRSICFIVAEYVRLRLRIVTAYHNYSIAFTL